MNIPIKHDAKEPSNLVRLVGTVPRCNWLAAVKQERYRGALHKICNSGHFDSGSKFLVKTSMNSIEHETSRL